MKTILLLIGLGACATSAAGDPGHGTGSEPLRGHYDVTLAGGRRLTGSFTAPLRATTMLCG